MDIATIISIAALATSIFAAIANYFYTRRQLAFSNFPVLQIVEAKTKKIARKDDNNPNALLSGTSLQFKLINQSKDISAIEVTIRVSFSRQRKNHRLFNVLHVMEKTEFYKYSWDFVDPKQSVATFEKNFRQEPILEYELKTLFDLVSIIPIEGTDRTRKLIKDRSLRLIIFVDIEYKSNRYRSQKLKTQERFLAKYYYDDRESSDTSLSWVLCKENNVW